MLNALRMILGVSLIVVAFVEVAMTTISVSGVQGPLTSWSSARLWRGLQRLSAWTGIDRIMYASGPIIVFLTFMLWVLLTVMGWGLVFSTEGAVQARGEYVASALSPFFYAGGQVLGQGSPDVGASSAGWKLTEQFLALHGYALLSLGLAWIIPVVGAVIRKRHVATRMHLLGDSPLEIVRDAWDGSSFGDLHLYLNAIADDLTDLAHRQFAYPVVHYFHTPQLSTAIGPRLAVLTEATFIMAAAGERDQAQHPAVLRHYWRAVEDYLSRMTSRFAPAADEAPPPPDVDLYARAGVLCETGRVAEVLEEHERIRRMLAGSLQLAGWAWDRDVASERQSTAA